MRKINLLIACLFLSPVLVLAQNVGVDEATPVQKLDVKGAIRLQNANNSVGVAGSIRWNGSNFQVHDGTSWITFGAGNYWGGAGADVYSLVSGNVGIGTSTPATKLQVVGTARVGVLDVNGAYSLPATAGASGFVLTSTGGTGVAWTNPALVGDITSIIAGDGLVTPNGAAGDVTLHVNPDNITLEVVSDQLRVKADGINATHIAAGAVGTSEIADGSILTSDISVGGVTSTNILDGTIVTADISVGGVTSANILDGTIVTADISVGGVTTTNILDGTILTGDISTGGVTTTNILDGTILTGDISTGGVTTTNILNGTILAVDMAAGGNNTVLSTISGVVGWNDPSLLTTVLRDRDGDTRISVDNGGSPDDDHIRMVTATSERMTIDNTGEVGIGTATPQRTLHVSGATDAPAKLVLTRGGSTATNDVLGELQFDSEATSGPSAVDAAAIIRGIASETHGNSNKGGSMTFLTKAGGGTSGANPATERMRISNTGAVSINGLSGGGLRNLTVDNNGILVAGSTNIGLVTNIVAGDGLILNGTSTTAVPVIDVVATNGLSANANNIVLGGTLTAATTISQGNNAMIYNLDGTGDFEVQDGGATCFYVKDDGNVGIGTNNPTYKLHINGKVKSTGINETSDARLKKDITSIDNAMNLVNRLEGVTYHWRKDEFPNMGLEDKLQYGLIAQEVEKIVPELVATDAEGWKSIEYTHLVPILLQALKEQDAEINSLKNNQLVYEKELGTVRAEMNQLESLIDKKLKTLMSENPSLSSQASAGNQ